MHKKGIDFELTIVGDGTQMNLLKELAKSMNIESKVYFTGKIPNATLPELLQKAHFYISMPITEGVSASLFEAMASNCFARRSLRWFDVSSSAVRSSTRYWY